MPTPTEQVKPLRRAIEAQQAAQEAARQASRDLARERYPDEGTDRQDQDQP